MRLAEGIYMPDMMEVNIPIRFIFVFLVPIESRQDPHGVGRAFGTLMANPVRQAFFKIHFVNAFYNT